MLGADHKRISGHQGIDVEQVPPFFQYGDVLNSLLFKGGRCAGLLLLESESAKLGLIKSGFMTDLLTGRVRVPDSLEIG